MHQVVTGLDKPYIDAHISALYTPFDDAYALYREVYDALQEPFRKAAKR